MKKIASFAIFTTGLTATVGCKMLRSAEVNESNAPTTSANTACVGLQGNGLRFPSHIGTYVALLENNIMPTVTLGGSSGSIVGAAVMGLLQNSSIKSSTLTFQGRNLTEAQRAALVLAAIPDVINSFIFLPALNKLNLRDWQVMPAILQFMVQSQIGKVLAGDDNSRLLSIEAIVGQSVLLTDFLMHANFLPVLQAEKYSDRRKRMFELWTEWADGMETSLKDLVDAAALPESQWPNNKKMAALGDRFYRIFQQDMKQENADKNVDRWRLLLRGINVLIQKDKFLSMFGQEKMDDVLSTKMFLANPQLLWRAYLGFGKNGNFLHLPSGLIIHSTARRGTYKTDSNGSINSAEEIGIENLLQSYIASNVSDKKLFDELATVRSQLASRGAGFQPYFSGAKGDFSKLKFAYPAERVVLLGTRSEVHGIDMGLVKDESQADVLFKEGRRGVAHAIAFSAGEPGPFRRLPVFITSQDILSNTLILSSGSKVKILEKQSSAVASGVQEGIVSFGGWSENVPMSTLEMLPSCQNATMFVSSGKKGPGNDFQIEAIRASIRGWNFITSVTENVGNALKIYKSEKESFVQNHFQALNKNIEFSRSLVSAGYHFDVAQGRWIEKKNENQSYFQQDIDFDAPSEVSADKKKLDTINGKLANNRFALMVVSYQKASENMSRDQLASLPFHEMRINSFGDNSGASQSKDLTKPANSLIRQDNVDAIDKLLDSYASH